MGVVPILFVVAMLVVLLALVVWGMRVSLRAARRSGDGVPPHGGGDSGEKPH